MQYIFKIIRLSEVPAWHIIVLLVMAVISSLLSVIPIQFFGYTLDALSGREGLGVVSKLVSLMGFDNMAVAGIVLFFVFSVIAILFRILFCYLAEIFCENVINRIRVNLFAKCMRVDFVRQMQTDKGDTIYTLINSTRQLENIFSRPLYTMFSDIFDLIWITAFILYTAPAVMLILVCVLPFIWFFSLRTAKKQKLAADNVQISDSKLTSILEQSLSGYETIKAFRGESYENRLFGTTADDSFCHRLSAAKSLSMFFPVEGSLRVFGVSSALIYTVYKVVAGAMPLGMVSIVFDYSNKFYAPVRNISQYYQSIQRGLVSAKRITEYFELPEEADNNNFIDTTGDCVVAENISLSLNGTVIFENLSFNCKRGDLIHLKGISGSGKSSLLRVLLGFYPLRGGKLTVFGRDINEYPKKQLRNIFAYAPQTAFLHNVCLAENVAYPDGDVDCADIICRLNLDGLDALTSAGENGNRFSGGERSRVGFARAVAKNADIIILDEVTASLDSENTAVVHEIISELKQQGKIIFYVSHDERVLSANETVFINCMSIKNKSE
ncbi:MAG: ABC transporter ATP-binding protein [Deferribacterales bacterium]